MNSSLRYSLKSGHAASRILNILFAVLLSWMAMDHLMRPKDLQDLAKDLASNTTVVLNSLASATVTIIHSFFSWLGSHTTVIYRNLFSNYLQTS